MIELTINFSSVEAAIVALDKLRAAPAKKATPVPASPAVPSTPAVARTPRKYVRKAKKAEASVQSAAATPDPADAPAASAPQPEVAAAAASEDEAKSAMEALYDALGVSVARETLSRFGVKRVGELLPEQRAEFIAKAKAVIGGEAP